MSNIAPTPEVIYIPTLFRKVSRGEIKIPTFQRDFVWSEKQILDLLMSIYKGYPMGSLLFWNTSNTKIKVIDKGTIPFPDISAGDKLLYVLDGMQRLSSLYGVFHFDDEWSDNYYLFNVWFNLSTEEFFCYDDNDDFVKEYLKASVPLSAVFNPRKMMQEQSRIMASDETPGDLLIDRLLKLQSTFQEYLVPAVTISNENVDEVVEIFERINNTGTKLSTVDFVRALTWKQDFDLSDEIDEIQNAALQEGFDFEDEQIMKIIAIAGGNLPTTDNMIELRGVERDELKEYVKLAKNTVLNIIDFLKEYMHMYSSDFISYDGQLMLLAKLFASNPAPSPSILKSVIAWYWTTSLNEGLRGKPDSYLTRQIRNLEMTLKTGNFRYMSESVKFGGMELREKRLMSSSALSAAVYNMFAINQARSIITGRVIPVEMYMDEFNVKNFVNIVDASRVFGFSNRQSTSQKILSNIILISKEDQKVIRRSKTTILKILKNHVGNKAGEKILRSQFLSPHLISSCDQPQTFLLERAFYMKDEFLDVLDLNKSLKG